MLLDIQGDMNAIKNTMNELKKLSDEEKAEEYYKYWCKSPKGGKQAYLDGLTEGRKEVTYMKASEYDEYLNICRANDQLKAQITELEKRINTLKIKNASLQKKNEQLKEKTELKSVKRGLTEVIRKESGIKKKL